MHPRARQLIDSLALDPHPEGGYYREWFRSAATVRPDDGRPERAALTTIAFLLVAGQHSRWHRVRSDEVWHFLDGEPLELCQAPFDVSRVERVAIGAPDHPGPESSATRFVHVVPGGWWQCARPSGAFTLAGCTVGPGFEYEDFGFLRDDETRARALARVAPELEGLM